MRPALPLLVVWLGGGCSVLNGLDERPRGDGGTSYDGSSDGGSEDSAPPDAVSCDAAPMVPVQVPATIRLMIDISGSMGQELEFGGVETRLTAVTNALTRVGSPLDVVDHMTRFGLSTFNSTTVCPNAFHQDSELNAREAVAVALAVMTPAGFTVGESFEPTITELADDPGSTPKALWIFTDTEPHTCSGPGTNGTPLAVAAIQAATASGIATRVVRLASDDIDASPFLQMAAAGGWSLDSVQTIEQLDVVVAETIDELAVCRFELGAELTPSSAIVSLDGRVLVYGDDWTVQGTTLSLLGAPCRDYRLTTPEVLVTQC